MEFRNFINGKFINSISKKNIPITNPATQEIVGNIDQALDDEIELAFKSAREVFKKRTLIDMDAKKKSKMMRAIASKLREFKHEGGKLLSKENGKSISQCEGEFSGAADTFDYSVKMAELNLLPTIRKADENTLIIADGTSCRSQILDGSGRKAIHVARFLDQQLVGSNN